MADSGIEFLVAINAKVDQAVQASRALDGVTTSAQKTDKAITGVEAEFQRLSKQLTGLKRPGQIAELRKEIHALENPKPAEQVGFLGKQFAEVEGAALGMVAGLGVLAIGGAIISGVSALVGKVHELGVELLMTAGEAQRTERAITLLMGADVAPDILEWIDQMARETEFTDGTLKSLAISLTKAGYKGQDLARAMSAVTDMAAMSENKLEGASSAADLLSRIRLKGGLGDRDLLRLGIAPDAFYKKLAGDLGMGAKQVEQQLREGKIRAEDVIEEVYNAIAEKTGKPLGGAGLTMKATFLSQLEKAKDIIPNLFEGLSQSGGLDSITASLGRLVSNLAPDSPNGKRLIEGLERMLNAFAKLIDGIDIDKFTGRVVKVFELLPPIFEFAAKALGGFLSVMDKVISRGSVMGGTMEAIGKKLGLGGGTSSALGEIGEWIGSPGKKLGKVLAKGITSGLAGGLNESGGLVYDAMGNLIGTAEQGGMVANEQHSPSRRFARMGAMTAKGYEMGILDSGPEIREAMRVAFAPGDLGPLVPDAYAPPAAAASAPAGGGVNISLSMEINIGSLTGDEKGARVVAEEGAAGIRMALQRIVEELAMEGA